MGLMCSKNFHGEKVNADATSYVVDGGSRTDFTEQLLRTEKQGQYLGDYQQKNPFSDNVRHNPGREGTLDDFYDGIPLVPTTLSHKSRSRRSTQAAVAKVSEVSVRLSRAGTVGLEKAVEVLDVLGSSMRDLNTKNGFASAGVSKGTKISILAFEVANTIMKGACLMHSLSESRIQHLKEVVFSSDSVQKLVSKDNDELLRIVACDKREELTIFSGEVIRFGNHCKDPQWHNLDRYFLKQSGQVTAQKQLKDDAETMMQQMMILVQYTAELYHELHTLHRFEQDTPSKFRVEAGSQTILREEFKKQNKLVKKLKKRSLWSRGFEEIMEKLVDVVLFLHMEIKNCFNTDGKYEDAVEADEDPLNKKPRLGPAGLALHYANIILQIDGMVAKSGSMPPSTRESLYQSLPPSIKSSLRSKIQSVDVQEELGPPEIKAEMEKTLQWLVPVASNTIKSHHGFGWVGEWANSGFEASEPLSEKADLTRIETLYHADKETTETYITDQLVWLHYLVLRSRTTNMDFSINSTTKSPTSAPPQKKRFSEPKIFNSPSNLTTVDDHNLPTFIDTDKKVSDNTKSEDFDTIDTDKQVSDNTKSENFDTIDTDKQVSDNTKSENFDTIVTDKQVLDVTKSEDFDTIRDSKPTEETLRTGSSESPAEGNKHLLSASSASPSETCIVYVDVGMKQHKDSNSSE